MSSNETDNQDYDLGKQYWSTIDATVDGMLGGFSHISSIDIQGSEQLLNRYFTPIRLPIDRDAREPTRALDCGAGIGRITKHLLLRYFDQVDLLEQNEQFLAASREYIGLDDFDERVRTICSSLHTFSPTDDRKYDVIWCQWVTGHLTDDHFVLFLQQCQKLLKPNGVIVIKDNHTSSEQVERDPVDGSVTRSFALLLSIFAKANLSLVLEQRQSKFPKKIYPVKMFVLR
jgi:protein N-terminal methyltransferase